MALGKFGTIYYYLDTYDSHGYFTLDRDILTIPNVDEFVYIQKSFRYSYFIVKERIFDSKNNIVHIRVERADIENRRISLRGIQW